jgi:SRSO17 transposase
VNSVLSNTLQCLARLLITRVGPKRCGIIARGCCCRSNARALEQINWAVNAGIELGVISADAAYGNDTDFRDELTTLGLRYCVAVRETTTVWEPGQGPLPPKKRGRRGCKPFRLRRDERHQPVTVKALAQSLPEESFRSVAWREGAKGELSSRFAAVRVRPAHRDHLRREPRPEA